jgi:hypothetical protein
MVNRFSFVLFAALVSGCAGNQAYSDATNSQERKAYITCTVTRAFLSPDHGDTATEVARRAMRQCDSERQAVMLRLIEENVDKPFGMKFVETYMEELQAAMLDHIALRLSQARARSPAGSSTGT